MSSQPGPNDRFPWTVTLADGSKWIAPGSLTFHVEDGGALVARDIDGAKAVNMHGAKSLGRFPHRSTRGVAEAIERPGRACTDVSSHSCSKCNERGRVRRPACQEVGMLSAFGLRRVSARRRHASNRSNDGAPCLAGPADCAAGQHHYICRPGQQPHWAGAHWRLGPRRAHRPERTTLYRLVQQHAATFVAEAATGATHRSQRAPRTAAGGVGCRTSRGCTGAKRVLENHSPGRRCAISRRSGPTECSGGDYG